MSVLYLLDQGSTLRKDGEVFVVTKDGETLQKIPAIMVEQVIVLGNINLTTPVIHCLLQQGIDCVFCSSYGKFHGRLISTESKLGLLRQRQMEFAINADNKLDVAKTFVQGKLQNQRVMLMRYRRELDLPQLDKTIAELERAIDKLRDCSELTLLRGIEGAASASYYRSFKEILKQDFGFSSRVRRPPTDPVNSLLSFGYTLLVYAVQSAVSTVGLDPFVGFLHSAEPSRPSLVLDLMEEFRPIIVDSLVLWLVNSKVMTEQDFERPQGEDRMVILTEEAIKRFIHHYELRLQTQVFHPRAQGKATYRRCFELQARELARAILKQEATYKPFLVR
ncbi:MAG: CRISPR-associated endonuclease Cas1 [Dehalococcoidia bacterium]